MTDDERTLMLLVATWVADQIGMDDEVLGGGNKEADEMRILINKVKNQLAVDKL